MPGPEILDAGGSYDAEPRAPRSPSADPLVPLSVRLRALWLRLRRDVLRWHTEDQRPGREPWEDFGRYTRLPQNFH